MIISTKGIVISKFKFKENDLIVKCYTASNGILSFLVKGVFSSKKSKLSLVTLFLLIEIEPIFFRNHPKIGI